MSVDNNSTIEQSLNIPKGWVETTLGEVCEIKYGKDHKHLDDGNISCYGSGGLMRKVNSVLYDKPSVLIPRKGTLSNLFFIKEPFWTVDTLFYTKINNEIVIPIFLYFKLKTYNLANLNVGSAVPSLTTAVLNQFSFQIPKDIKEQIAIAKILTAFDDKIENLQAQNKTLETTAQTIFKEWFGKYQIGDLSACNAQAGELPDGWRVGKLGEVFDITIGRTPPRKEKEWFSGNPIGKKWISIKDIGNSGTYILNTSEYLTDEAIEKFNIPIIPINTAILSFKMTVGKLAITTEDMLSNEAIAHLKLKEDTVLSTEFIYLYLQDLDFNALGSTSSIVTAINSTMIKNLEIFIPEAKLLSKFEEAILSFFRKIKLNTNEIQTLKQTRDTLLPKLMSGALRVSEFKEAAL